MADCLCPHGERSLGRLYGISMGRGTVRLDTHPACPVHAACAACGSDEWDCYKKRWAKGFGNMLNPCCGDCSHLIREAGETR